MTGRPMTDKEMEALWAEHMRHEFVTRDLDATLATMVEDATVNHVPIGSGGNGKAELRAFYRDVFIGSWPDDLQMTLTNRVFGDNQLVEEDHMRFTHKNRMEWFLPGVAPTHRLIEADFVVVVQFRDGKLVSCPRSSSPISPALGVPGGVAPPRNIPDIPASARLARNADRSPK